MSKLLQGRLFSYADTHRHRLGANYHQIPVNCPYAARARNYQRDGPMTIDDNQGQCNTMFQHTNSVAEEDGPNYIDFIC